MEVQLSCYLVLLSPDSKNQVTRQVHLHDTTHITFHVETNSILFKEVNTLTLKKMGDFF